MHLFISVFLAGFSLSACIVRYHIIAVPHKTQTLAVLFSQLCNFILVTLQKTDRKILERKNKMTQQWQTQRFNFQC